MRMTRTSFVSIVFGTLLVVYGIRSLDLLSIARELEKEDATSGVVVVGGGDELPFCNSSYQAASRFGKWKRRVTNSTLNYTDPSPLPYYCGDLFARYPNASQQGIHLPGFGKGCVCSVQHSRKINEYDWFPSARSRCRLRPFDAHRFCRILEERDLDIIITGDSIAAQMGGSITGLLSSVNDTGCLGRIVYQISDTLTGWHTGTTKRGIPWDQTIMREVEKERRRWNASEKASSPQRRRRRILLMGLGPHVRLDFLLGTFKPDSWNRYAKIRASASNKMKSILMRTFPDVIARRGLNYTFHPIALVAEHVMRYREAWRCSEEKRDRGECFPLAFAWYTNPPFHVSCRDFQKDFATLHYPNVDVEAVDAQWEKSSSSFADDDAEVDERRDPPPFHQPPDKYNNSYIFTSLDAEAKALLPRLNFTLYEMRRPLLSRVDGHIISIGDCLHWCAPGPLDLIAKMLFHDLAAWAAEEASGDGRRPVEGGLVFEEYDPVSMINPLLYPEYGN